MTEQTLERAIEIKRSIDGCKKIREEIEILKGKCLEKSKEEQESKYCVAVNGEAKVIIPLDTLILMLDTEIKKVTEEIESLSDKLDKVH